MKRLFYFIFTFILITLTACSNKNQTNISNASNLEDAVAYKLEQIDKNQNLDDETLKSLSVVIRTNLTLNNELKNQTLTPSNKYKTLVNHTKNETLKINGNTEFIDICTDEYSWKKSISKDKILNYAQKNNISLSNISNINSIYDNDYVEKLEIGGKEFDYKKLSNEFGFESNQITNIETTNKEIIIYGINKGFNSKYDLKQATNLSKQNKNYKEILENLYKNSTIL